ncbi:MAG: 2-phospho-L-lactate guanylyltransferase [Acidimicrobiia bacterium]
MPVKSFAAGLLRLESFLDPHVRRRLGMALVIHTVECLAEAGAAPVVVSPDSEVLDWAQTQDIPILKEAAPGGLDAAAHTVADAAATDPWAVVHSDLPLLTTADIDAVRTVLAVAGVALAPAADGGTAVYAGHGGNHSFAYGPGSFHRHLRHKPRAGTVTRPGLALDLDTPDDLAKTLTHPRGQWVGPVVGF